MIRQFNPHYRIFKTAREVLNETSNSQLTRIIITPRLQLIMEHGADQRRENLPVADEIALLLWRNGMCGLKDHDCRARMEARQGREGATRQQNNQTTEHQQDIGIS
jgi:hypothetical protein